MSTHIYIHVYYKIYKIQHNKCVILCVLFFIFKIMSTKRIQPARGWCAIVGGLCKLYPPTPLLRRPGHPVFWGGSQPCVPAAWLAERLLLAGNIESNAGPKPTLKTLSHTRTHSQVH